MLTPKVVFSYSWIYDQMCKKKKLKFKSVPKGYPSPKIIWKYIKKIEKIWRKDEKKVLTEIARITGLKWKSKFIKCYVVGREIPFSDPLTMPIYEKYPDYFVDILTHELIHNIFIQNEKECKNAWKYFLRKYRNEALNTKFHIPLHAIHKHVFLKFYDEWRLNRDIRFSKFHPEYAQSWKIVQASGHQKIIKEFSDRVKR